MALKVIDNRQQGPNWADQLVQYLSRIREDQRYEEQQQYEAELAKRKALSDAFGGIAKNDLRAAAQMLPNVDPSLQDQFGFLRGYEGSPEQQAKAAQANFVMQSLQPKTERVGFDMMQDGTTAGPRPELGTQQEPTGLEGFRQWLVQRVAAGMPPSKEELESMRTAFLQGESGLLEADRIATGQRMNAKDFAESGRADQKLPDEIRKLKSETGENWASAGSSNASAKASLALATKYGEDTRHIRDIDTPGSAANTAAIERSQRPARPATGAEKRTMTFYLRAQDAEDALAPFEEEVAQMGVLGEARIKYAPNIFQSDTGQAYNQAQRQFTEARLRKDSGATIKEDEYASDQKTFFAQPGDTPQIIARKRAAREKILEALKQEAGRAYEDYTGESVRPFTNQAPSNQGKKYLNKGPNDR